MSSHRGCSRAPSTLWFRPREQMSQTHLPLSPCALVPLLVSMVKLSRDLCSRPPAASSSPGTNSAFSEHDSLWIQVSWLDWARCARLRLAICTHLSESEMWQKWTNIKTHKNDAGSITLMAATHHRPQVLSWLFFVCMEGPTFPHAGWWSCCDEPWECQVCLVSTH